MLLLFVICALICLILMAVAGVWLRFGPNVPTLSHEKSLYAGFLNDIDRRVRAGHISEDLAEEEKVEAARALLKASESESQPATSFSPVINLAIAMAISGACFALYFCIGHPSLPDQPYKSRLQVWTHMAKTEPDQVPPLAMAAVLRQASTERGGDPQFWLFLGRVDMLAGNAYAGAKDYERAQSLAPSTFTAWSELGEALTFISGSTGPDAQKAFETALKQNPQDARAHYYLGRQAVALGHYAEGRSHFTAALSGLSADDSSRAEVEKELAGIGPAEAAASAMKARISSMVASLDAKLKQNPDNPEGWARLLRAYDVLGDVSSAARARTDMEAHYRSQPDTIADILTKSQSQVGSEDTGGMK